MGFFENQDRARLQTARLWWLYGLAIVAIVACANLVVAPVVWLWYGAAPGPGTYAAISLATLAVIAAGTIEIVVRLSLGEAELALLLAGRRVPRGTGIEGERRLINVVDEMAIASGLAAPPVYVLHREPGINAFAAGRSANQAIVVVTRGALEQLTRDELQAVVAHEFSHILNGDIALYLRATCALQGIVFLSAIGRFMMRYYSGYGTEEGRRFFYLPLAVIGAGLFAIGAAGLVCARLIQAAISREREFLADACAVQYTRNGEALCMALARISASREGSRILNWHADAMAHMLFAGSASTALGSLFATHPPIDQRILHANPHLPPSYYRERLQRAPAPSAATAPASEAAKTIKPTRQTAVTALLQSIGSPSGDALGYAADLLAYMPGPVREALAHPAGAQAVMLALVLDEDASARERQKAALEARGEDALGRAAEVLAPLLRQLDRAYRLPLVALALPVLRKDLDPARQEVFLGLLRAAVEAHGRPTLSKFVLETIVKWNIGSLARRAAGTGQQRRDTLRDECVVVLSLLAHAGNPELEAARAAFDRGAGHLRLAGAALASRDALAFGPISEALASLRMLPPLEKAPLLEALGAVAEADGNVRLVEHELLRAIGCALESPIPPSIAALDPRLLRK